MKNLFFGLIIVSISFVLSCGEGGDSPQDIEIKGGFKPADNSETELIESTLGYISSLGEEFTKINEHKVINLKNGDRIYYVNLDKQKSGAVAYAFQFSGTYHSINLSLDSVVVTTCDNDGACPDCLLIATGNCGVMSCSCSDKSGIGSFDCVLNTNVLNNFKSDFLEKGKKLITKISIPKLQQVNCENL